MRASGFASRRSRPRSRFANVCFFCSNRAQIRHRLHRASNCPKDLGGQRDRAGSLFYAVHVGGDGTLARVKIKSPSFSNWRAFPFTVHDTNMMDYAINEASFGLTIAGCDR